MGKVFGPSRAAMLSNHHDDGDDDDVGWAIKSAVLAEVEEIARHSGNLKKLWGSLEELCIGTVK